MKKSLTNIMIGWCYEWSFKFIPFDIRLVNKMQPSVNHFIRIDSLVGILKQHN